MGTQPPGPSSLPRVGSLAYSVTIIRMGYSISLFTYRWRFWFAGIEPQLGLLLGALRESTSGAATSRRAFFSRRSA